jgi:signal transduction histidine kinase
LPLALVHGYLRAIFPDEYDRNMYRGLFVISLISALIILCFPPRWFTYVGAPYTVTLLIWSVYALIVLMRSVLRRRPGAWVNAAGWFIFTGVVYWDTLYYIGYLRAGGYSPLGFQVFVFAQSWFLARRYADSMEQNENLGRRIRSLLELTRELNRSGEAARTLRVAGQALQAALAASGLRLFVKDSGALSGWSELKDASTDEGSRTTCSAQDAAALDRRSSAVSLEGGRLFAAALRNGEPLGVIELCDPLPGAIDREVDYIEGVLESTALALENIRRARLETLATVGQLAAEIVQDINRHCELILQQASRARGAAREAALQRIEREIEFMRQMALDILDYARDRIFVQRSVCAPEKLAESMRNDLQRQFADSGIEVSVRAAGREPLFLDVDRFRRVALNLAKSSAETLPKGGRFRVEIAREADSFYISFEDDGPGMPPEKLSSLYEPAAGADPRGAGLGLAVVRRIVHAHDGVITAGSRPGAGSRFVVILPAAVSDPDPRAID